MTNRMNQGINSHETGINIAYRITNLPHAGDIAANFSRTHGEIVYNLPEALRTTPEQLEATISRLGSIFEKNVKYSTNTITGENTQGSLTGVKKRYVILLAHQLTGILPSHQETQRANAFAEQYEYQNIIYNTMNSEEPIVMGPGLTNESISTNIFLQKRMEEENKKENIFMKKRMEQKNIFAQDNPLKAAA